MVVAEHDPDIVPEVLDPSPLPFSLGVEYGSSIIGGSYIDNGLPSARARFGPGSVPCAGLIWGLQRIRRVEVVARRAYFAVLPKADSRARGSVAVDCCSSHGQHSQGGQAASFALETSVRKRTRRLLKR